MGEWMRRMGTARGWMYVAALAVAGMVWLVRR
jgi:hypothetical protein